MTDCRHPTRGTRSTVDVTVDPSSMMSIRDDLRLTLLKQYHYLLMEARAHRKVGNATQAHQGEEQARRTAIMIWTLDNPMAAMTDKESEPGTEFDE